MVRYDIAMKVTAQLVGGVYAQFHTIVQDITLTNDDLIFSVSAWIYVRPSIVFHTVLPFVNWRFISFQQTHVI